MSFEGRLVVGLNGQEPDVNLFRYASMVARLNRAGLNDWLAAAALHSEVTTLTPASDMSSRECLFSPRSPSFAGGDPEVRFVYLLPGQNRDTRFLAAAPLRAVLREQIKTYFRGLPEYVSVGCDVLTGSAVERLPAFAADFGSDLLLLGDASWPRWKYGRLAMEAPCSVWLVPAGWAPVLRRVLVPIDFSERSAASLRVAIDLASRFPHAKCLALHVYHQETRFRDDTVDQTRRRKLADEFQALVAGIDTHNVRVEPLFVEGHCISRAIAIAADQHSADLVVMATRGRTRSARLMLNSLTETAIRECRGSFLVVKSSDTSVGFLKALWERLRRGDDLAFS